MKLSIALLSMLVAAASPAAAAKLPVHYRVDFKEYKKIDAGAALDFDIYSDAACTNLVHSETLLAGDPGLRQEKILSQKVKGQSPKPPLEMQLKVTLDLTSAVSSAFLQVSGSGVVPTGAACQAQISVPTSSASLVAVDANGNVVGPMIDLYHVAIPSTAGLPLSIPLVDGVLQSRLPNVNNEDALYYTSSDCSGPPQISPDSRPWDNSGIYSDIIVRAGGTVYRKPRTGTSQTYASASFNHHVTNPGDCGGGTFVAPGGCCFVTSSIRQMAPPETIDISHVTGPLTVELQ